MPGGNHEYEDVENYPAKDWEEGEFCAVCHNGGEFVGCDRCPRVYHLECYIPELTAEPADGWICLLCRTKKEFEKLSNDNVRLGGNMAKRDRQVCVRLLFEVYNVYPESISFKLVKNLDFHQYRTVINKPIALDVIKSKLDIDHTDAYMSVADFVSDVRLMFQNCRTFWKTFTGGDIYIEHATNLWKHFEELWKDWKVMTSHATAPAFIIAPYEKKKAVSHNNFPKEREGRGGRGRKPGQGAKPNSAGRPFRETARPGSGPGPRSSKDPLLMTKSSKGRTRDDSSDEEPRKRKNNSDHNNNADEKKHKKKRAASEEDSEDDYNPRDEEDERRKKKIKAEKFSPPSSKSWKDKKMKREKDSEDEDSDDNSPRDKKRPGPVSSKQKPTIKKRDSEGESESEDEKPRKSDKARKKREADSEDYDTFKSQEFADLPMH